MANQHPGPMTSSSRHSGSLTQSHCQLHAQPGTLEVYGHSGTRDFLRHTTPIGFRHSPYPVENTPGYPHLAGESHPILPNHYGVRGHLSLLSLSNFAHQGTCGKST